MVRSACQLTEPPATSKSIPSQMLLDIDWTLVTKGLKAVCYIVLAVLTFTGH